MWASNFRGPHRVDGGSALTQWEWSQDVTDASPYYEDVDWGPSGTPYLYGQACYKVTVGAARPNMGYKRETVYEHDEYGNPDDYVGGFMIDRTKCETDVWSKGYPTGWTAEHFGEAWGSLASFDVGYKLWCYSCQNTTSCTTGIPHPTGGGGGGNPCPNCDPPREN
jgi:hypothetical protein